MCDENCKSYAIIQKCTVNNIFYCNTVETSIPTIYTYEKVIEFISIDIDNIIHVCCNFKVDTVSYAVIHSNFYEIE